MIKKQSLIIGIDEAGRGPLAGPITLSVFCAPLSLKRTLVNTIGGAIKDSKQFSEKRRKEIYRKLLRLRKENNLLFFVTHISNIYIDRYGISKAAKYGITKALKKLSGSTYDFPSSYTKSRGRGFLYNFSNLRSLENIKVLLDGSLKAPSEYKNQKTIIGGDGKDVFIACASIIAKVRRDGIMKRIAKKYPRYHFEAHKGYGTKLHYKMIKKYGLSYVHRKSFCKNIH
jgi:ribonuclease HII